MSLFLFLVHVSLFLSLSIFFPFSVSFRFLLLRDRPPFRRPPVRVSVRGGGAAATFDHGVLAGQRVTAGSEREESPEPEERQITVTAANGIHDKRNRRLRVRHRGGKHEL